MILDEPQAGLDPQSRILVREYIRTLAKKMTILLTTHDMDEADRLSDRIGIIDHGQLLVLDTPENLKKQIGQGDILELTIANQAGLEKEEIKKLISKDFGHFSIHQEKLQLVADHTVEMLPTLLKDFKNNKIDVEDIVIRKKTLEDVFISLTGRRLRE